MKCMPKVFIGSSSESLDVAQALEYQLQDVAGVEVWDRAFRPGRYTLEELVRKASEVDFAVFILGQEDKTYSRGQILPSPRDNVVYEAGLFAGRSEVSRVFLLVDARGSKIPSDWEGLGYITYHPAEDGVHKAGVVIRKHIKDWCATALLSLEQQIPGHWWQYVVNLNEGSVVSLMSISRAFEPSRWKISGRAWTREGKNIAEFRSRAAALDTRDRKLFYYWEGEHPFDKSIPLFFGVGEVEFDEPACSRAATARGWYSESPLSELDQTVRRSTRYIRATDDEVGVIQGNEHTALEGLVSVHLEKWKAICA